jgi:hypothetical protein
MRRRRPKYYKLIGRLAVPCSMEEWAGSGAAMPFRVEQTEVGPMFVSTVFLGLDHNWSMEPDAPAILFETMIFGADADMTPPTNLRELLLGSDYQRRYATWDEAEKGHAEAVEHARRLLARAEAATGTWAGGNDTVSG